MNKVLLSDLKRKIDGFFCSIKISVFIGIVLGVDQCFSVDDVELNMPELEVNEGTYEVYQAAGSLLAFHNLGAELQVQHTGCPVDLVTVFGGIIAEQYAGRSVHICTMGGRSSV